MKIFSEKIKYGISAIFELAKNQFKGYIQIKDIAQAQKIPQNYLEQLLITLKKSELVESMRGMQGGYRLKKLPNEIKIIDVIRALDGPFIIFENSENSEVFRNYWSKIEQKLNDLFSETFEALLNEENVLHKKLFFQI